MLWCNLVCCFEVVQIRMGRQRESFVQNFAIFGQYEQWRRHGGGKQLSSTPFRPDFQIHANPVRNLKGMRVRAEVRGGV